MTVQIHNNEMQYNDKELREAFHLLFLENLLRVSSPNIFVLKGGVNLRFFFKSPRYSEDMDLDVLAGSVPTLKKNAYKILENASFRRSLATYGIVDLKINDPAKAKQTETTQRFRLRLVTQTGEEFPTKIEYSRRSIEETFAEDNIDPEISAQYMRLAFRCQHFIGASAATQKIQALAGRPVTQARDVFDLYILYLGNHLSRPGFSRPKALLEKARECASSIHYDQYRDQVEEYLTSTGRQDFGGPTKWKQIQTQIMDQLK